ncbi:acetyl-CoA synthetase-like protein, partial [Glonium stellatum]
RWTYSQLGTGAKALASCLEELGLQRGNAILFFCENCAEYALFCWAAVYMECPFVPINPRATFSAEEVQHMLKQVCPGVIVVTEGIAASNLETNARSELASAPVKIIMSRNNGTNVAEARGWTQLEHMRSQKRHYFNTSKVKVFENTAIIGFTSGTTSFPKACPKSSENLMISTTAYRKIRNINPADRLLQHLPGFAAMGVYISLVFWTSGATVVYPSPKFDAAASLHAIESEKCTHMFGVPAMVKALSMHSSIGQRTLNSLRVIELGGAEIFPEILELCVAPDKLQCESVGCGWGMTEAPGPLWASLWKKGSPLIGDSVSVGTPIPGTKAKICALGSREPLNRGEEGELHVGGPQVIRGYLNGENDVFYSDGKDRWMITGDMALIDDYGEVYIIGRYKDIIIRGGQNISPARIERCLGGIHGVEVSLKFIVVGAPDDIAGEVPVAVLKLSGNAAESSRRTIRSLQEIAMRELGPALAPQMFLDLQEDLRLEAFPSTLSGKQRKMELAARVREYLKYHKSGVQ